MKLSKEIKLEVLEINIEAIDFDHLDALIIIDEDTYNMWLNHLLLLERYEDCNKLKENKDLFVKSLR